MTTWNGASAVMTDSKTKVVCDAGPIIHLDELNCLDLLNDFEEIILPSIVYEEIRRYRPSVLSRRDLPFTHLTQKIFPDEPLLTICRIFSLDAGETEALAVMKRNPEAMLLTDDASARLVAQQMGLKAHGTIGILIRSMRRGQREPEEVLRILAEIPLKSTLYIKHSLLEEIILTVKKEFRL